MGVAYDAIALLELRKATFSILSAELRTRIASLGLCRHRGCRAGRRLAQKRPFLRRTDCGAFVVDRYRAEPRPIVRSECPPPCIDQPIVECTPRKRTLVEVQCTNPSYRSECLGFATLNIRSLSRKVDDVLEVCHEHAIDLLCLVETWHDSDSISLLTLRHKGYNIVDRPRPRIETDLLVSSTNHGGIMIMSSPNIRHTPFSTGFEPSTFEHVCARVSAGAFTCSVITIYRPGSEAITNAFFSDLSDVLDRVAGLCEPLFIVGDINVRLDRIDDSHTIALRDLFEVHDLTICSTGPTHTQGGVIDVVATRHHLSSLPVDIVDVGLSDHHMVRWHPSADRPASVCKVVNRRPWRHLTADLLRDAVANSALCQPEQWNDLSIDELAQLFDEELNRIVDHHIPSKPVVVRQRTSDPWFDAECRRLKRDVRKLERFAYKSTSPEASVKWHIKRREYRALLRRKRYEFWNSKLISEADSPRTLWQSIDTLLGRGRLRLTDSISADQFLSHFSDRVARIRRATENSPRPTFTCSPPNCEELRQFREVTSDEVLKLIRSLPDKYCALDPLPPSRLKEISDLICPFLVYLFNRSLTTGQVPESFKTSYVTPRLKKPELDRSAADSYRPISNLPIPAKMLERLVCNQLVAHLESTHLLPRLQSAYRFGHSTETAVLKVLSDILTAVDSGDLAALVMLDLSAAFDTIDHDTLIRRLEVSYQLHDSVLRWFRSYIVGRRQYVRAADSSSSFVTVLFGVPQGSVLGPILFLLYIADLEALINLHRLMPHFYADDTQVYGSCSSASTLSLLDHLTSCVEAVAAWMGENRLQLNTKKTELIWLTTRRRSHQIPGLPLRLGPDTIQASTVVRNLGMYLDSDLSMRTQVMKTTSACFHMLRQLRSIRRSIPSHVLRTLVSALVLSRLDYGNALLTGIPTYLIRHLQSVLNAAARLIFSVGKFDHIDHLLQSLHWLKAPERIVYKISTLTYKCLNGLGPDYLADQLTRVVDSQSRYQLRSSEFPSLVVRRTRLATYGDRAFSVAAARSWNNLPTDVSTAPTLDTFRKRLKTFLFKRSYPTIV